MPILYFRALLHEFRYTLGVISGVLLIGIILYAVTPQPSLGGARPSLMVAWYGAWMALLAQPIYGPPQPWYLLALAGFYPVLGLILVGEGVVRFALLMVSRKLGEKEWMRVMASTYRDHIVLCGLGNLGARVLEEFAAAQVPTVVLERDKHSRFLSVARELNVPYLIRDMKEDQALLDAGIPHARAVVICTNDEMANLEVALDSRRLNPSIRVVMRVYQQIGRKIASELNIDSTFSASALAAPAVVALALNTRVLSSMEIAGVAHVTVELAICGTSAFLGRSIAEVEEQYSVQVLAHVPASGKLHSPASPAAILALNDLLVVYTTSSNLPHLSAASCGQPATAG